jgi:hypothetical protein
MFIGRIDQLVWHRKCPTDWIKNNMNRIKKTLLLTSYAQADNTYENGALSRFRDELSRTLRFVSGNEVSIFQEGADVEIGQQVQERISQSLNEAMVLIPVLTPSFFTDQSCRDILSRFLERERQLRRNDLVLAVYYQHVPALDNAQQADDTLIRAIAQRRMLNWQPLRGKDFNDPQVRQELERLAQRIVAILDELEKTLHVAQSTTSQEEFSKPSAAQAQSQPNRQPEGRFSRQLTMKQMNQLVVLLLKCPAIQHRSLRDDVLAFLPDNVRNAIPRRDQDRADVVNIVRTCNQYPGALDDLVEAIRSFNEGMFCMQALDDFLKNG